MTNSDERRDDGTNDDGDEHESALYRNIETAIMAGLISTVTGAISHREDGWYEGVAILVAVVSVVSVGAFNNWFRKQEAESKKKDCLVLAQQAGEEDPVRAAGGAWASW